MHQINLPLDLNVSRTLKYIQDYIPGAVIAGGYLRDKLLGKQYKDIDIFIPFTESVNDLLDSIRYKIQSEPIYQRVRFNEMPGCQYRNQTEITRVWDLVIDHKDTVEDKFEGYQFIMLQAGFTVEDRIKHHDFGICQIWHDGINCYYTDAFDKDLNNGTFTLVHCETLEEYERSMRRWKKFKERFPGWELAYTEESLKIAYQAPLYITTEQLL